MDKTRMRTAAWIALALALAACANDRKPAPAVAAAATYGPAASVAPPVAAPPAPPRAAADQCGLDELRGVVGRSRLEIPIPLEPGRRRVLCDSCPRSEDFVARRQTVLFDARTGLVTSVACG